MAIRFVKKPKIKDYEVSNEEGTSESDVLECAYVNSSEFAQVKSLYDTMQKTYSKMMLAIAGGKSLEGLGYSQGDVFVSNGPSYCGKKIQVAYVTIGLTFAKEPYRAVYGFVLNKQGDPGGRVYTSRYSLITGKPIRKEEVLTEFNTKHNKFLEEVAHLPDVC